MRRYIISLLLLCFLTNNALCEEIKYILHDRCINLLYKPAVSYFKNCNIKVYRDSRGIILRFELQSPEAEYHAFTPQTIENITKIEYFLAKIKNPVIIEVHIAQILSSKFKNMKRWEVSAVIASNIEYMLRKNSDLTKSNLHSVGYGEFLPENNTPNNGGKLLNRVDIIILCNISGE